MTAEFAIIQDIVPEMYLEMAAQMNRPPHTNMAQSNQCHVLTRGLHNALHGRGLIARREYHSLEDGRWHYLIAHHDADTQPSDTDIITDLNPWQFMPGRTNRTFLHGERREIQEMLRDTGAPEWFISLRGIATIAKTHVL